jgi:mutator protein MutT
MTKNRRQQIGILAILKHKNKYLFVRRSLKSKYEAGKWGFVGEKIEFGESPEETVSRGVKEELGVELKDFKLFNVYSGVWEITDEIKHVILIAFIKEVGELKLKPNYEVEEYAWLTLQEARKKDLIKNTDRILSELA